MVSSVMVVMVLSFYCLPRHRTRRIASRKNVTRWGLLPHGISYPRRFIPVGEDGQVAGDPKRGPGAPRHLATAAETGFKGRAPWSGAAGQGAGWAIDRRRVSGARDGRCPPDAGPLSTGAPSRVADRLCRRWQFRSPGPTPGWS
jgi:hypothetical protein